MKISKSNKRNMRRLFLSFIISFLFILCLLGLFCVFIEAEDMNMTFPSLKKDKISFIPYEVFDIVFYILK